MLEREDSNLIKSGVLEDLRRAGEHCDVSLYTKDGNVFYSGYSIQGRFFNFGTYLIDPS